jgi:hypothetical protein
MSTPSDVTRGQAPHSIANMGAILPCAEPSVWSGNPVRGLAPIHATSYPGATGATEACVPEPEDPRARRRAEDAALLARIVARDEAAVEALYACYSGPLYSLAYQVTGAERFAQDVIQEVFIAL